jgi:hypothetical protein
VAEIDARILARLGAAKLAQLRTLLQELDEGLKR